MQNRYASETSNEMAASVAALDNILLYASDEFARYGLGVAAQLCLLARVSIASPPETGLAPHQPNDGTHSGRSER